jgi:ribosomal protein S11
MVVQNKVCRCYVKVTKTNVFVTVTDLFNNVLFIRSGGIYCDGKVIKRRMRRTWYLAETVASNILKKLVEMNYKSLEIYIKGRFNKKVKTVISKLNKIQVLFIKYIISVPHNGLRTSKMRRM